jgi:hypothetical protein
MQRLPSAQLLVDEEQAVAAAADRIQKILSGVQQAYGA